MTESVAKDRTKRLINGLDKIEKIMDLYNSLPLERTLYEVAKAEPIIQEANLNIAKHIEGLFEHKTQLQAIMSLLSSNDPKN